MNKIINVRDSLVLSKQIKKNKKTIVLSGGCFDILHAGHIKFLENAKKQGDYLFVLLENDESVRKLKGPNRPINRQKERARVLSAISFVDYIVLLNRMRSDKDYDRLILGLSPDIIATTKNDSQITHNKRQARMIDAKVVIVTDRIKNKSTTILADLIAKNFNK